MKSWEQLGLDGRRLVIAGSAVSASFFGAVAFAGEQLGLDEAGYLFGIFAGIGAAYLLFTAPRRSVDKAAFEQTIEAPSFAASSNIYMSSTRSRSNTLLLLRAEEPHLSSFLISVRRRILLGHEASTAVHDSLPQNHIFSESISTVINSIVGLVRVRVEEGGEELEAILSSGGLDEETKLPLFIAVSFFLPIMLMLFSATSKQTGPVAMAALVVLELVILDITLAISGSQLGWGGMGRRRSTRK